MKQADRSLAGNESEAYAKNKSYFVRAFDLLVAVRILKRTHYVTTAYPSSKVRFVMLFWVWKRKILGLCLEEANMTDWKPLHTLTEWAPVWDRPNLHGWHLRWLIPPGLCVRVSQKLAAEDEGIWQQVGSRALVAFADNEGFVYVNLRQHSHMQLLPEIPPLLLLWSAPR